MGQVKGVGSYATEESPMGHTYLRTMCAMPQAVARFADSSHRYLTLQSDAITAFSPNSHTAYFVLSSVVFSAFFFPSISATDNAPGPK